MTPRKSLSTTKSFQLFSAHTKDFSLFSPTCFSSTFSSSLSEAFSPSTSSLSVWNSTKSVCASESHDSATFLKRQIPDSWRTFRNSLSSRYLISMILHCTPKSIPRTSTWSWTPSFPSKFSSVTSLDLVPGRTWVVCPTASDCTAMSRDSKTFLNLQHFEFSSKISTVSTSLHVFVFMISHCTDVSVSFLSNSSPNSWKSVWTDASCSAATRLFCSDTKQ